MICWIVSTNARVRWRVADEKSAVWADIGGFQLLNPVLADGADKSLSPQPASDPTVTVTDSGEVVFSSESIGFVPAGKIDPSTDLEYLLKLSTDFLLWARYLSFQHQIPSAPSVSLVSGPLDIEPHIPVFPRSSEVVNGYGRAYLTECCLTRSVAQEAAVKVTEGESVPVHHHLLVDAYAAMAAGDYRQSILYSAMSIESMAAARLEKEYEKVLAQQPSSAFRVVELNRSTGNTVRKDPIYELLASRTNFSSLLHERPLYLISKSLLIDNHEAYRVAMRMYSARNKIVHRGELSDEDASTSIPLDVAGSKRALSCAVEIFNWFGDSAPLFPKNDFISMMQVAWEGKHF